MLLENRITRIVSKIIPPKVLTVPIVSIILDTKIYTNTKIRRISEIYQKYILDTAIPPYILDRTYLSHQLASYIKTYYCKQFPKSNLKIVDIGGGNGDVLKHIGTYLKIPKQNLFCVEPKDGWNYNYTNRNNITYVFWDNKIIPKVTHNSIDVVIIMVTLHHMQLSARDALFSNLSKISKKGSLLIIKEHDSIDKDDVTCISWEHALYELIKNPVATSKDLKVANWNYYEDYKSKQYWDKVIFSYGYTDGLTPVIQMASNKSLSNPTNLYWKVYVKS